MKGRCQASSAANASLCRSCLESSPATTILKMSVLPSRMADLLGSAAKAADESVLPWAAMARGVGVIYFALLPAERTEQTLKKVAQGRKQDICRHARVSMEM